MARFSEVLDQVRSVLTWASPGEVKGLLDSLVEEQIISEVYRDTLSLHQLRDGVVSGLVCREASGKPGRDEVDGTFNSLASADHRQMSPGWTDGSDSDVGHMLEEWGLISFEEEVNSTRVWPQKRPHCEHLGHGNDAEILQEFLEGTQMDVVQGVCSHCPFSLTLSDEKAELLSNAEATQKPASDSESVNKGNLENEEEWLEQVEEAARRIAVPLWQHWDVGRGMLQAMIPGETTCCSTRGIMVADCEARFSPGDVEKELELAGVCRTLDACAGKPERPEVSSTPHAAGDNPFLSVAELSADHITVLGAGNALPVEACAGTETSDDITDMLEGHFDALWPEYKTIDTTENLFHFTADRQWKRSPALPETSFLHLLPSDALNDTKTVMEGSCLNAETCHSKAEGGLQDGSRVAGSTTTSLVDGLREVLENMELHRDAKMQECDQALLNFTDLIPDGMNLSEYMNDDLFDPSVLLSDSSLNSLDDIIINGSDTLLTFEVPGLPDHGEQTETNTETVKSKQKRKRPRVPKSQRRPDEKTSPKKKRREQPRIQEENVEPSETPAVSAADVEDVGVFSKPAAPAEPTTALPTSTPPAPLVRVYPSPPGAPIPFQLITIPDKSGYQVVRLSSSPRPLIRLPNMTSTYILVPATPPPCKPQVAPLSPVDGAVAPVLMSSFPPGSLSDTASKAMSPTSALPPSPSNEASPCKESPKSPSVVEIPQGIKDYIQQYKANVAETCQAMEAGLSFTSHYVDVQVSRREIVRSGKSTNKCLDKELIITGDIDRQKSLVGQSQIFENQNGEKCKRYVLLFGNAGMGKTTLIKKLCLDWSRDAIPQFDFVFVLDGKQLTLTEPVYSLQTLLLSLSSFASPCADPEGVYSQILAAPKQVLVIFDGFDELRDYETLLQTLEKDLVTSLQKDSRAQAFTVKQLFSAVLQRVLLPGCTLLLASRPRGAASQLLRRADSFLEVSGFAPPNVEAYFSKYFADPTLRESAVDHLKNSSFLKLLCWNPGLCHLACVVLEESTSSEVLPRTLTELCHRVLCLKLEKDRRTQSQTSGPPEPEALTEISNSSQVKRCQRNNPTKSRGSRNAASRSQRSRRANGRDKVDEEDVCEEAGRKEDKELLTQLSSLAWEGVKSNKCNLSLLPREQVVSSRLKAFGLRMGLLLPQRLRTRPQAPSDDGDGGGKDKNMETGAVEGGEGRENRGEVESVDDCDENILLWASPFLQSFMAAVHLSLSRAVHDRSFLQTLPFQTSAKSRRKPQREELELTQRFAVGLLFQNGAKLGSLHSHTETVFRDMVANKRALVTKHLQGLSFSDLSPAQVLEVCNYVYEASFTQGESGREAGGGMLTHLAANLPELMTFRGVPLNPPDVFAVQNALERSGPEGRSFSLDLEDSGIQICGLRALVGLDNIITYRACIADVVTLWEQLEHSCEDKLLQRAVCMFKIHPLKVTQVCHIEHLEKLVGIHVNKRLSESSSQSESILAEGVPAVRELYKLEFELGPENGPLVLPKLWDLLPGLQNLQHLDLEKSKIGDKGAEKLASALMSLSSLEILNLSQNCIGDEGVKKLALGLKDLPKLHCLSLYSNVISDEGAESLAAVLPHMASLTELDVKYNKMTDVGAQSLGASLINCKKIKTLRMWNQCIPYGVFERLQQKDSRILWH